jgi:Zn-dependent M16 (insulinase) family peptidase
LTATFFPSKLPIRLRPLLPLYINSFFSLPIIRADSTQLTYEQVVKQLDAATVSYGIMFGSYLSEDISVCLKVERSQYSQGISWLRDLLSGSKFDLKRLKIITSKQAQTLQTKKQDGHSVALAGFNRLIYDPKQSNSIHMNMLSQLAYLKTLLSRFETDSGQSALLADLEELRGNIIDPSILRISVSGDILTLNNPCTAWSENFCSLETCSLQPVVLAQDVLSQLGHSPKQQITIYSMISIESSTIIQGARSPDSFNHPDIPAIEVAIAFLNGWSGPLFKYVREPGLVRVSAFPL